MGGFPSRCKVIGEPINHPQGAVGHQCVHVVVWWYWIGSGEPGPKALCSLTYIYVSWTLNTCIDSKSGAYEMKCLQRILNHIETKRQMNMFSTSGPDFLQRINKSPEIFLYSHAHSSIFVQKGREDEEGLELYRWTMWKTGYGCSLKALLTGVT